MALLYLLTVTMGALRLPRGPTLLLTALSAGLWDFLFIPPRFTFFIGRVRDFMMFGIYFVIALVIAHQAAQLREREEVEHRREARATALYRLTRALAASRDLSEALRAVVELIQETFEAESAIYLRTENGLTPHPAGSLAATEKDESMAAWSFQKNNRPVSPPIRCRNRARFIPLLAANRAEGVLAVRLPAALSLQRRELLDACAAQLAIFLDKERALAEKRAAQLATQSQQLQKTLFDSVSHELKAPLAALSTTLQQDQPTLPRCGRRRGA